MRITKHPKTGKWEKASWVDDKFGHHNYGVSFPSEPEKYYDTRKFKLVTKEWNNGIGVDFVNNKLVLGDLISFDIPEGRAKEVCDFLGEYVASIKKNGSIISSKGQA